SAWVVINPVMHGTGLKIKNVEALGYGKPVVTTTVGAEGLELALSRGLIVADSEAEFIQVLSVLVADASVRSEQSLLAVESARTLNELSLAALGDVVAVSARDRFIAGIS